MADFRIREIYKDTERILIAVESVAVNHDHSDTGCWVYGRIEAIALIVLDQESAYAFDTQAQPVSIELLSKDIPKLAAMIPELHARIKSGNKI